MFRFSSAGAVAGRCLLAVVSFSVTVFAQSASSSCSPCKIGLSPVVSLGDGGPGRTFLDNAQVVRDSRGYFYVSQVNSRAEIHVFDQRGTFVRSIGRYGKRPGEFGRVYHHTIGPGDSLFVMDQDRRLHVFDPNGRFVRAVTLSLLPHSLKVLPNGRLVAQGALASPEAAGYPLHLLDARGKVIRSFGSRLATLLPDDFTSTLRMISLVPDGSVLAAWPNRYVVERWDTAGRRVATVTRDVGWFEPWVGDARDLQYERPRPFQGAPMLKDGTLWTAVSVADMKWRQERSTPRREGDGAPPLDQADRDRLLDMLIEALDPRTGQLLSSYRLSSGGIGMMGDGFVFIRRKRGDGRITLEVVRVALTP